MKTVLFVSFKELALFEILRVLHMRTKTLTI